MKVLPSQGVFRRDISPVKGNYVRARVFDYNIQAASETTPIRQILQRTALRIEVVKMRQYAERFRLPL